MKQIAVLLLAPLAVACGGGTPTGPGTPTPPPPGYTVSGFVFYDENGNGVLDPSETVRLPGVTIAVGSQTAQSSIGGRFTASNVPSGAQTAAARAETLPVYFTAGAPLGIAVPPAGDVAVPAVLNLGAGLRANVYMAFGDSITVGDGSSGGGYRDLLQANLRNYWGKATVVDEGQTGTKSDAGAGRIGASLSLRKPAYALILYGTNDYNVANCKNSPPCDTVDNLLSMIQETEGWGAHPILGTIPPVNPLRLDRYPDDRNAWVATMNGFIRTMANQQHVPVADIHRAFLSQGQARQPDLFSDDKHPSDLGYQLIAQAFFGAITQPYSAATSASRRTLFRHPF